MIFRKQVVAAEVIVIRDLICSSVIVAHVVDSRFCDFPSVEKHSLSRRVFPASMCAMIPMFLTLSNGAQSAIFSEKLKKSFRAPNYKTPPQFQHKNFSN
jgi:hypothetical protein